MPCGTATLLSSSLFALLFAVGEKNVGTCSDQSYTGQIQLGSVISQSSILIPDEPFKTSLHKPGRSLREQRVTS